MTDHDGSGRGNTPLPQTYEDENTLHLPGDMHLTDWGHGVATLRRGAAQIPLTADQADALLSALAERSNPLLIELDEGS